jgi:hypothetical protein
MTNSLPPGFAELETFAAKWAKPTEYERAAARRASSPDELNAFYVAALKRLPEILERIDHYALDKVEGADRQLYHIALALAEVAPHVEFYKSNPNVPFAFREDRMFGVHSGVAD